MIIRLLKFFLILSISFVLGALWVEKQIFYTKSEYIRIKQEYATSHPDPYVGQKILAEKKSQSFMDLPAGILKISPFSSITSPAFP